MKKMPSAFTSGLPQMYIRPLSWDVRLHHWAIGASMFGDSAAITSLNMEILAFQDETTTLSWNTWQWLPKVMPHHIPKQRRC